MLIKCGAGALARVLWVVQEANRPSILLPLTTSAAKAGNECSIGL